METNDRSKVAAFDTLFSTNHIQMLKVMLPYMDNQTQKSMAVYIKFLELNYTIEFYKKNPYPICGCMEREESPDFLKMCNELLPYCTEQERKQIKQIRNIMQSMEMYKEMSKAMELMKDFMPDMASQGMDFPFQSGSPDASQQENTNGFDIMGMLMNMLTPEQKQMFDLFGGKTDAE